MTMTTNDTDIFGASSAGGGGKLNLPEAPYQYAEWATTDPTTGAKTEHVGRTIEGHVVAYYRNQQWDNETRKPRVQKPELRDGRPNPKAGQPQMQTTHYVLLEDDTIVSTDIYGLMFRNGDDLGPYLAAQEKGGLKQYDRPIGAPFAQRFAKLDGQRRVFQFKMSPVDTSDEAAKARVVPAFMKVLEYVALLEGARAGASWLNAPGVSADEKRSATRLLEVIEAKALEVALEIAPKNAAGLARQTVTKILPVAMEAVNSRSAEEANAGTVMGGSAAESAAGDAGSDDDSW